MSGGAKIIPARDTILLPYQARWVEDDSRLKIAEKSRQIGWTWAAAYRSVKRKASAQRARHDAWISSRDEIQARLFLEDCKTFAKWLSVGATDLGQSVFDKRGATAYVLQFASGRRIHSMSSNPDAQAGKRGDRIIDEFALHEDPRKLYAIAYPGITWGGSLEIFSTHRGSRNFFNELITEIKHKGNPKNFSLHSVSLQQALEQGLLFKLQCKLPPDDPRQDMDEAEYFDFIRSGCPDDESFQEEFCCHPSDDQSAFLSYDLISSCEYRPDEPWELSDREDGVPRRLEIDPSSASFTQSAPTIQAARKSCIVNRKSSLYLGVDIGRDHDLTVLWLLEKLGDVCFTRNIIILDRQTFDSQEKTLYDLLSNDNIKRVCIDQTGLGRQFTERAQKKFGKYRVEGIHFTAAVKEELAYPVRAAFEDKTIRLPSDPKIRADLRSIRKETTASGNIRFTGERTTHGHADRFWALALALHAAKESTAPQFWAQVI